MATMPNMIKQGAEWPEQMCSASLAFLTNDLNDTLEPLPYRVLLMLPSVYRMWSKTRLRHLNPRLAAWALPEIYVGIERKGAEDAAYSSAILVEWCRATGMGFTGGSTDVYKCFDQVMRPLVKSILEAAGMPVGVVSTYTKFLEKLCVCNTVGGGLGEAYTRPTSMPQGDPILMMVVPLLLRPWVMQKRQLAVKPRFLADDLQIISI